MKAPVPAGAAARAAGRASAFFVNLGDSSIWDANEAYYVETPREMIESGDYVNPSFNYEPRFNKPVLCYWIVAGLYQRVRRLGRACERTAIAAAALIMIVAAWFLARAASTQPLAPLAGGAGPGGEPALLHVRRRIFIDVAVTALMTLTLLFFALSERYPSRRRAVPRADVRLGRPRRADERSRRRRAPGARVRHLSRRAPRAGSRCGR